jgi:hypothetical protein
MYNLKRTKPEWITNKVIVYNNYVINIINNVSINRIIDSYNIFLINWLHVPIIYYCNNNYFVQQRIKNVNWYKIKNSREIIFSILGELFSLYEKTKRKIIDFKSIDLTCNVNLIRKTEKTIGDIMLKFILIKIKWYSLTKKNKKEINKILYIISKSQIFSDVYICYIHWNINYQNILFSNDEQKCYFIDYETGWYFDYHLDLLFFYKYFPNDLKDYCKLKWRKINFIRLKVCEMIENLLHNILDKIS